VGRHIRVEVYKAVEGHSLVSPAAVQLASVLLSYSPKLQAWCRCYLLFFTTLTIKKIIKKA